MKNLLLVCCCMLKIAAYSQPVVWVTNSLDRMTQKSSTGNKKNISIQAAKGEWESFQVIIKAGNNAVTINDLSLTNFKQGNKTIPASAITLYREHFIKIDTPTIQFGGTVYSNPSLGKGRYADALVPFVDPEKGAALSGAKYDAIPYAAQTNEIAAFWIDVLVPAAQAAGNYTSTYTLKTSSGSYTGTITLDVYDFVIPVRSTLYSHFQTWLPYNVSERKVLLRNRLSPGYVDPKDDAVLVPLGLNCASLGFWSGADISTCEMDPPPPVNEMKAEVNAHDPSLLHYNYSADEISDCPGLYDDVKAWGRTIHAAGAEQLITMVPVPQVANDGTGRPAVDIFPILPKQLMEYHQNVKAAQVLGADVWMYSALVQDAHSPKWLIDFTPVGFRNVGMLCARQGLTGILNWSIDFGIYEGDKVWDDGYTYYSSDGYAYVGEGNMLYPGRQAGIDELVQSLRLKWLRDAVEDYEYYHILQQCGQEQYAQDQMRLVAQNWYRWSKNIDSVLLVRNNLAAAIQNCNTTIHTVSDLKDLPATKISIYPNPAHDYLFVSSPAKLGYAVVYDMTGRILFTQILNNLMNVKIDIQKINPGTYLLSLFDKSGNTVAKQNFVKK